MRNPFRYPNSSPEVIRLAVMMYVMVRPNGSIIGVSGACPDVMR